ncbi:Lon protease family protein [Vibrio sp. SS-MA-C1-2]|uniref:AAA family ATPase n=1 Tax=Vibrio sp. SS-MA-C1-2 TaxID=2908646 RepID=UPI001F29CAD3|nr:Lon protease family protein [Vibrio sp. SS-MA-C1-2]UJF18098.1 Lon protease family protein [Vibrio sp. SS-MA-C1-2]
MNSNWQSLSPDFSELVEHISPLRNKIDLLHLQPRLENAIQRFISLPSSSVMMVNSIDHPLYRHLMNDWLGSRTNQEVINCEYKSKEELFGYIANNDDHTVNSGVVHHINNGFIILPVAALLADPRQWQQLKLILANQFAGWPINNKVALADHPAKIESKFKLVLMGDRYQLADFNEIEPDLYHFATIFSDFENDIKINKQNINLWCDYTDRIAQQLSHGKMKDIPTYLSLLATASRYKEEQLRAPLCPVWYQARINEAKVESNHEMITASDIKQAALAKDYRESYLANRTREDIEQGQVIIDCQGSEIGQVNGLTVIDIAGHPKSYGEPARISCVVHLGDGDIADVERKAELGGNIHAKGMMIMQAFLSSALQLEHPLPFSASIVFEQSYSEVDGDSASLAELCALVSALAIQPLNQQIAVTGAVDQFGRVQAVGGINEKVEGFFRLCSYRGLTGSQGVILPETNLSNLCLSDDVIDAVKNNQFHIWSVNSVDQALKIISGIPFDDADGDSLLNKIAERIQQLDEHAVSHSLVGKIIDWFVQRKAT